jgi:hypothetical protein
VIETAPKRAQAYQLLPALDADQRDALRQSIETNGILQPIEVDEEGRILDGHHRAAIAAELGIACPSRTINNLDEAGKRKYAITVNLMRRQLDKGARSALVAQLRTEGMSLRAIAAETGIPKSEVGRSVQQLSQLGQLDQPERVMSLDGKDRRAVQPKPVAAPPKPSPASVADPVEPPVKPLPPVPAPDLTPDWDDDPDNEQDDFESTLPIPVSPARPPFESNRAPEPSIADEDAAIRSSEKVGVALAALFLALDPDPVRWVANRWRPNAFAQRDLPRVRDAFTSEGLRKLGDHLYALADHLDENGVTL